MTNELVHLQAAINGLIGDRTGLRVLEAGCGSLLHVTLGTSPHIVGIDISAEQLRRHAGLHERILGDIRSHPLGENIYDAIVCWDVLEHIDTPVAVVYRFARALRAGGILVLAFPNVRSLKGFITKYTPFWAHRLGYRYLFGMGEVHPFPTYLKPEMDLQGIQRAGMEMGLTTRFACTYESEVIRRLRSRLPSRLWKSASWLVRTLLRLDTETTDVFLVMAKQSPATFLPN